jgi:hypothetical protein
MSGIAETAGLVRAMRPGVELVGGDGVLNIFRVHGGDSFPAIKFPAGKGPGGANAGSTMRTLPL